ncbi:SDR family oxidoreductase [Rhodospirillum sp. A1_3_36]|uniref:SDR family oxidoreductase n=1 Tax=Rhodospirillum sp. A1_3_36 TaxID=3391666 RepID=UPI0039A457E4
MEVSCHSFLLMAKYAAPLMTADSTMLTISFSGGHKVVEHNDRWVRLKAVLATIDTYGALVATSWDRRRITLPDRTKGRDPREGVGANRKEKDGTVSATPVP